MQICKQCQYTNPSGSTFCNRCGGHLGGHKNPLIDRIIGKYQLKQKIGGGGFGMVYRAEHIELGNSFAIKLLHPHLTNNDMMVKRFMREGKLLANLRHNNIVQVIDSDHVEGFGFYLVMEWLEGRTFQWHLKEEGTPPIEILLQIFEQLLDALAYAHGQGIVHRDLKPENLILIPGARGRRTLKILDFGIARMVEDERDRRLTETGLAVGTPRYMSPEQAAGEIDLIDHRADLYACGVLLVEMLTGRQLFLGSTNEILLHHMDTPAPTLSELAPGHGYPPAVEQLVAKALAKHPHERFQSAEAFADQLFTVFGMEPSAWGPTPSRQTRAPQPAAPQTGRGISTNALPGNASLASTGQHTPQSRVGPDPSAITRALPGKQGTLPPPLNHPQGFSMGPGSTSGVGYSGEKQSDSIAQMPSPKQPTPKKSSSQGMLWVIIGLSGGLALGVLFFIIGSLTGPSEQPQTRNIAPRREITPPSPTRFPEPPRNTTNPLPKVEVEQATLRLIPDPSDAIVLINGKRVSGDIPLLVKVKKDTRVHVLVKHPKYVTKDFFWVGAKDEMRDVKLTALTRPESIVRPRPRWRKRWRPRRVVRRRFVRRRVVRRRPPTPRDTNVYFTLRIYSNPGKATILVNDVPKGRSPLTIRALKGQRTKIFVKKQGYLSQRFYWTPTSNTSRRVKLPEDIFGGN